MDGARKLKSEENLDSTSKKRLDTLKTNSDLPGLMGHFETFLRKFRTLSFTLMLTPVIAVAVLCMGVALTPAIYIVRFTFEATVNWALPLQSLALGISLATGYLAYGITLLFVVPLANLILPFRVKPFRGIWFSVQAIPWFFHNALTYIVRFTFLEFVTPSPLNVLFFRMMGMKIGKGVVINTSNISDPGLITLGDYVTIGGSATIFAHYGQKGILIISPVEIKKGATIGLKSSIMGDVVVGEKATVKAHTVLLPKSRVGDGEVI